MPSFTGRKFNAEDCETYGLAAIGMVQGVFKYYVRPEITAKRGWMAIGALVLAYEMAAPPGELLSEGVDAALETHPYLTTLAIGAVALHLANVLPEKIDPFRVGLELIRGV
jgi:hypothetical protein